MREHLKGTYVKIMFLKEKQKFRSSNLLFLFCISQGEKMQTLVLCGLAGFGLGGELTPVSIYRICNVTCLQILVSPPTFHGGICTVA